MILITRVYPLQSGLEDAEDGESGELYGCLKGIYIMLQGSGRWSIELLQAGLHIAAWEHNMGMVEEAWLSIGGCVKIGLKMGLDMLIKVPLPEEEGARRELEDRRCVWWGCVVLERYVQSQHSRSERIIS